MTLPGGVTLFQRMQQPCPFPRPEGQHYLKISANSFNGTSGNYCQKKSDTTPSPLPAHRGGERAAVRPPVGYPILPKTILVNGIGPGSGL